MRECVAYFKNQNFYRRYCTFNTSVSESIASLLYCLSADMHLYARHCSSLGALSAADLVLIQHRLRLLSARSSTAAVPSISSSSRGDATQHASVEVASVCMCEASPEVARTQGDMIESQLAARDTSSPRIAAGQRNRGARRYSSRLSDESDLTADTADTVVVLDELSPCSPSADLHAALDRSVLPASQCIVSPDADDFEPDDCATPSLVRSMRGMKIDRKLSFEGSERSLFKDADRSSLGAWLDRDCNGVSIVAHREDERKAVVRTIARQLSSRTGLGVAPPDVFKYHVPGNVVVVTSKAQLEDWADAVRALPDVSLLIYSESLAKRRRMGVRRVSAFDVTLVTFDVLCAKELALPEDDFYDSADEEEIAAYRARNRTDGVLHHWLFRRGPGAAISLEVSQLHMIHWRAVIVDLGTASFLRPGSSKGDAVRCLLSERKVACLQTVGDDSKVIQGLRGALNVAAKVSTSSILLYLR